MLALMSLSIPMEFMNVSHQIFFSDFIGVCSSPDPSRCHVVSIRTQHLERRSAQPEQLHPDWHHKSPGKKNRSYFLQLLKNPSCIYFLYVHTCMLCLTIIPKLVMFHHFASYKMQCTVLQHLYIYSRPYVVCMIDWLYMSPNMSFGEPVCH